jgi:adenylate kinase family enzyme
MDARLTASFPHTRIAVVGVTGSGKSLLAEKLASRFNLDFIELDALYWKPGWVESNAEEFRASVEAVTRSPAWVLAGNYGKVRDIVWLRAQALVWLDYPFLVVLWRLWSRTWRRYRTKERLWGTNYEKLFPQFKIWSKESLFNWLVQSYGRHKRQYPQFLARPEYSHLVVYHFKRSGDTEKWLNQL